LRDIGARDAGRDALPFFDLGVQEDEAVLIVSQELVQRDVLDGSGG
jgi:hypothetical protein